VKLNRTVSTSTAVAANIATAAGGSQTVTAVYSGDSTYPASTSNAVTLTGTTTTAPGFTIASTTATQTILAGETASYTLALTPQNGFTGAVALSCSGLPAGYTCGFAPASVTLATAAVNAVMTISSTASASVAPLPGGSNWAQLPRVPPFQQSAIWLFSGLAIFGLMITGKGSGRRTAARLASAAIVLVGISALQGCGGKPHTGSGTTPVSTTYTVTVTGTSGALTSATTVTLIATAGN
jgi:trimeric autotransporter adhesin